MNDPKNNDKKPSELPSYKIPENIDIPSDRKEALVKEASRRKYSSDSWNIRVQEELDVLASEKKEKERQENLSKEYAEHLSDDYQSKLEKNARLLKEYKYEKKLEDPIVHKVLHDLITKNLELENKLNSSPDVKTVFLSEDNNSISTKNNHQYTSTDDLMKIINNKALSNKERQIASDKIAKMKY